MNSYNTCVIKSTTNLLHVLLSKMDIWKRLSPTYVACPKGDQEWNKVIDGFWKKWQYPNCLGGGGP